MKKLATVATLLLALGTGSSMADGWVGGLNYTNVSGDTDDVDVSVGLVVASLGYEFNHGAISYVPELKLGTGVNDDQVNISGINVDVEADRFASIGMRLQYDASEKLYVYAVPSYGNLKLSASAGPVSVSDDDWEWGAGVGAGYRFNDAISFDVSYERFDDANVVQAGMRYRF